MPGVRDRPPPVPSKDDDDSPPGSPSSISTASTLRPVTPPTLPHEALNQQFDDMRRLMGTLIGKTNDLASEVARSRSYEVDMSPRGPGMRRIEDLLRRALLRLGDSEFLDEYNLERDQGLQTPRGRMGPVSRTTKARCTTERMEFTRMTGLPKPRLLPIR